MPPQPKKPGPRSRRYLEAPVWVKAAACEDCLFYQNRTADEPGECRRKPPRFHDDHMFGLWPAVRPADWCGDFKR
jgi:hypothetical protein